MSERTASFGARSAVAHGRFALLPFIEVVTVATFFLGGAWLGLGGAVLLLSNLSMDELGGEDRAAIDEPNRLFLDAMLYVSVPLALVMVLGLLVYTAAPGTPLGEAAATLPVAGSWVERIGAVFSVGIVGGWVAGAFGHELMHRAQRGERLLAMVALARCLYAPMTLEHVYGHHVNVGLPSDPTTSPRGKSFWRHLPRAVWGNYRGAAAIEARRLRQKGRSWLDVGNRFLQGLALQLLLIVLAAALAGVAGLAAFVASAAISVVVIETASYMAHYGLVRVPGAPVAPRHSWSASRFVTNSSMINLPRHAHHHMAAGTRYWELTVLDDAPRYPYGTAVMSAAALLPPLFFRLTALHLADWDARLASDGERALLGLAPR